MRHYKDVCCHLDCMEDATHVVNPNSYGHYTMSCKEHIEELKEDGLDNEVITIEEWNAR